MRHQSFSSPITRPSDRRYISRRSVPPTQPYGKLKRSSSSDPCSSVGISNPTLKWKLIKFALLSSGLGLMGSALFGVGLLDTLGNYDIEPSSIGDADRSGKANEKPGPDYGGGAHGIHAVANKRDMLAKAKQRRQNQQAAVAASGHAQKAHGDSTRPIQSAQDTGTATAAAGQQRIESNQEEERSPLARGIAGLPLAQTPALIGGRRGHIDCDINVDALAYWNDPQGRRDLDFVSPFATNSNDKTKEKAAAKGVRGGKDQVVAGLVVESEKNIAQQQQQVKYLTFQPDSGGWNNVRMSLEIIFIVALALGRTLVLPPPMPLYLLTKGGTGNTRHRTFGDFYPLQSKAFGERMDVITMEEFLQREGGAGGRFPMPEENRTALLKAAEGCDHRKKSEVFCGTLDYYLQSVGVMPQYHTHPDFPSKGKDACFIFDEDAFKSNGEAIEDNVRNRANQFCGEERSPYYFDAKLQESAVVHFKASEKHFRLCQHFYGAVLFTDPSIDNYYKRFVRDFMHYHAEIYCAAGKIVHALQREGAQRGFALADTGAGGYSAMHIRRGDLQFKKVKIPAKRWYTNTKEVWREKEILYIATDERNKTWFDPIREHHDLRFLEDYWDMAGLGSMDPNYFGMIDTIVAARGRAFAGTFFSTFSGYINRMRGYYGQSMKDSYYSYEEKKFEMHEWHQGPYHIFSHEWPTAWIGIDGDEIPSQDKF